MTFLSFLFALPNQCVNTFSCRISGHSAKATRFLSSNYIHIFVVKGPGSWEVKLARHVQCLFPLSPLLISPFAGPCTAESVEDRIANRNCICFCLVKPKILILFYELNVDDNWREKRAIFKSTISIFTVMRGEGRTMQEMFVCACSFISCI